MLPKHVRLRNKEAVLQTIRKGKRIHSPFVTMHIRANRTEDATRIACVVGKKVSKSAVARHKYQRWLREISREGVREVEGVYDIVLIAKPRIVEAESFDEVRSKSIHLFNLDKNT